MTKTTRDYSKLPPPNREAIIVLINEAIDKTKAEISHITNCLHRYLAPHYARQLSEAAIDGVYAEYESYVKQLAKLEVERTYWSGGPILTTSAPDIYKPVYMFP